MTALQAWVNDNSVKTQGTWVEVAGLAGGGEEAPPVLSPCLWSTPK